MNEGRNCRFVEKEVLLLLYVEVLQDVEEAEELLMQYAFPSDVTQQAQKAYQKRNTKAAWTAKLDACAEPISETLPEDHRCPPRRTIYIKQKITVERNG